MARPETSNQPPCRELFFCKVSGRHFTRCSAAPVGKAPAFQRAWSSWLPPLPRLQSSWPPHLSDTTPSNFSCFSSSAVLTMRFISIFFLNDCLHQIMIPRTAELVLVEEKTLSKTPFWGRSTKSQLRLAPILAPLLMRECALPVHHRSVMYT